MDERPIRTSAKALVVRDGRMLALRLCDADGDFFIMPGGGQRAGELLPDAVRREALEETGVLVSPRELAFVIEGAHGEPFHRVDLVFLCDYEGEDDSASRHPDANQTGVEWLDIETLNTAPLYPSKLRRAIMNLCAGRPHAVYLGNEEAGDPEITE